MPERQGWVGKIKEKIPTKSSLMALGAAGSIALVGCSQESGASPDDRTFTPTATLRSLETPTPVENTATLVPTPPEPSATVETIATVVTEPTAVIEKRGDGIADVHVNGVSIKDLWANYNASLRPPGVPTLLPFSSVLATIDDASVHSDRNENLPLTGAGADEEIMVSEVWYDSQIPKKVRIPKLAIDAELIKTKKIPAQNENGEHVPAPEDINEYCRVEKNDCTYETPNYGIATPEDLLIGDDGNTTILIYSHSRWEGVAQPFNELTSLSKGDILEIVSEEGDVEQFVITKFKLFNYGDDSYSRRDNGSDAVVLQATFSDKGVYLMDEVKGSEMADEKPEVYSDHMGFHVIALPVR